MIKKNRSYCFWIILTVLANIVFNVSFAGMNSQSKIRMAILDNFTAEQFSLKYKDAYFAGIDAAVFAAKEKGFTIEYKTFSYGNNPLDIGNSISEVMAWHPDFIIGPHSSNQFLLLKKWFKNILVLSPYATDEDITKMPSNFYSLSLPDSFMAKANVAFMAKYFPGKSVFNITKADCKDCLDMAEIFSKLYKQKYPRAILTDSFYVGSDVKKLNLKKLMVGYKKGSLIVLQPLSYADANILMPMIAEYLNDRNVVFISNLDNWGNSKEAKKITTVSNVNYLSFRVDPVILNKRSKIFQKYVANYKKRFHEYPKNTVSYMSYASVMSVVDTLVHSPFDNQSDMRRVVLSSFLSALKKNPDWYRPKSYTTYKLEKEGEIEQGIIANF